MTPSSSGTAQVVRIRKRKLVATFSYMDGLIPWSTVYAASNCPDDQEIGPFMEPHYSLMYLLQLSVGPHPEPHQPIPHHHILFHKDPFR